MLAQRRLCESHPTCLVVTFHLATEVTHEPDLDIVKSMDDDGHQQAVGQSRVQKDEANDPRIDVADRALILVTIPKLRIGRDRTHDKQLFMAAVKDRVEKTDAKEAQARDEDVIVEPVDRIHHSPRPERQPGKAETRQAEKEMLVLECSDGSDQQHDTDHQTQNRRVQPVGYHDSNHASADVQAPIANLFPGPSQHRSSDIVAKNLLVEMRALNSRHLQQQNRQDGRVGEQGPEVKQVSHPETPLEVGIVKKVRPEEFDHEDCEGREY